MKRFSRRIFSQPKDTATDTPDPSSPSSTPSTPPLGPHASPPPSPPPSPPSVSKTPSDSPSRPSPTSPLARMASPTKSKESHAGRKSPTASPTSNTNSNTTTSLHAQKKTFDVVKINRYGIKQNRVLVVSREGFSNRKGKSTKWSFPARDIFSIDRDPRNASRVSVSVIRRYAFETSNEFETNRLVNSFCEMYGEHVEGRMQQYYVHNASQSFHNTHKQLLQQEEEERQQQQTVEMELAVKPIKKRVSIHDFELIKILGRGSFSRVVLVRKKDNQQKYAMKILLKSELKRRNQVEHTNTERKILTGYSHPFIVKLHFSFQTQDKLYMCLEFVSGGELFFHLKRARRFPEALAVFYAAEVALALEYLHTHNIIYRDLKPENCLLDESGHIKLTDFGLSKAGITSPGGHTEGVKTRTFCGTPDYLAPEIIQGMPHGKGVDYWGLGVLLYEMLTGHPPFRGANRKELYEQAVKGDVLFPEHVSAEARSIITQLLHKRPENRLGCRGIQRVKQHPFFRTIEWDRLLRKEVTPPFKPVISDHERAAASDPVTKERAEAVALPMSPSSSSPSPSFAGFSYTGSESPSASAVAAAAAYPGTPTLP